MKNIISIVVKNNSSVLARVSSLFGRRGFNIDSLSVSATDDPHISRITVVADSDEAGLAQIINQTKKLEETISVRALKESESVFRELSLVKILTTNDEFFDKFVIELSDRYGAIVVDVTAKSMIVELTGTSDKIDSYMNELAKAQKEKNFVISKVCRTGITAIERGV
ncbi:MAG: acetolactate synthase small subunit [Clostridia bacterium]|nr:acetolactate synthase small subunit [Clostridia bacterium]MDE6757892.1 acetolactate synthase small subunit [Clostridia bacterium]MDE7078700.1 acetolactate synthase small subunit [Clostridia bacterium]